ncbi:hypothetical protein [uncultured Maricaulis sp.]|uniref:hypothetical protein n=1 Tax=uncultured Maricaulis sp. TaxID=174710 RepID=UPI0030DC83BF
MTAIAVLAVGDHLASGPRTRPPEADVSAVRILPVTHGAGQSCHASQIDFPGKYSFAGSDAPPIILVHPEPGNLDIAIDMMQPAEAVMVCDERDDRTGVWAGIVYGGTREQCRLDPVPRSVRAYAGPCRSGWIELRHIAGSAPVTLP